MRQTTQLNKCTAQHPEHSPKSCATLHKSKQPKDGRKATRKKKNEDWKRVAPRTGGTWSAPPDGTPMPNAHWRAATQARINCINIPQNTECKIKANGGSPCERDNDRPKWDTQPAVQAGTSTNATSQSSPDYAARTAAKHKRTRRPRESNRRTLHVAGAEVHGSNTRRSDQVAHVPHHCSCHCYRTLSARLTSRRRRHGIYRGCRGRETQALRSWSNTHRLFDLRKTQPRRTKRLGSHGSGSTLELRRPEHAEGPFCDMEKTLEQNLLHAQADVLLLSLGAEGCTRWQKHAGTPLGRQRTAAKHTTDEQVATIRANRITAEARRETTRAQSYQCEQSKQTEAEDASEMALEEQHDLRRDAGRAEQAHARRRAGGPFRPHATRLGHHRVSRQSAF